MRIRSHIRTNAHRYFIVAATAIAVAVPAPALAAKPQSTSQQYTVGSSGVPGVDTGFTVKPAVPVTVTGSGNVCPFGGTSFCPGPDGDPFDTTGSSFGGFVLPGAPAWGLVGRVGSGPWIQVGSGPTTLSGSGDLVFAVNDDLFSDNAGSFTATVSYTCYPGHGYGDQNHYHC